jgi:hypothetical protein
MSISIPESVTNPVIVYFISQLVAMLFSWGVTFFDFSLISLTMSISLNLFFYPIGDIPPGLLEVSGWGWFFKVLHAWKGSYFIPEFDLMICWIQN